LEVRSATCPVRAAPVFASLCRLGLHDVRKVLTI